jgi:hypothetical protein
MGVFLVPLVFVRLFAPQKYLQGIILMGVCGCLSFFKYPDPNRILGHYCPHHGILLD